MKPHLKHVSHEENEAKRRLRMLALGALGVVYGDIGTSPLYALRECFQGPYGAAPNVENVVAILSLIIWSITFAVVFKYLTVLMRANNNGEGGIMALLALLTPKGPKLPSGVAGTSIMMLGIFGAALLYGDGVITPAVSVLGAVEGLEVATPFFRPVIVPITVAILIGLFSFQKRGAGNLGRIFGPAMIVWFVSISAVAVPWIFRHLEVFAALSPLPGLKFILGHGVHGFLILGSVVLCITGAEALYADMGHFGVGPIRRAWYSMVYPALIINYLGQGALMIENGANVKNPFFELVPSWFLYPMVVIAAGAAVIASQALISGVFSLTQQATQLGYLPRSAVIHTSEHQEGQIYIPRANQLLMIACIALVLIFQTSASLTPAYGFAVTGTMAITSILFFEVARKLWEWPLAACVALVGSFLIFDLSFLAANLAKIEHGGWVPIALGSAMFLLMSTWRRGRALLSQVVFDRSMSISDFQRLVERQKPVRVRGTAVFMTPTPNIAPRVVLHNLHHNHVLHERVIFLTVGTRHVPLVPVYEHGRTTDLGNGIFQINAAYGYMERPNIYDIFASSQLPKFHPDDELVSFFLGRETLLVGTVGRMARWRKRLFAFLSRNAQPATAFFGLPPERVIEIGLQLEL